jgi:adenylate kinase family enzyme
MSVLEPIPAHTLKLYEDSGLPEILQQEPTITDDADVWNPLTKDFHRVRVPKLIELTQGRKTEQLPISQIWGGSETSPNYSEDRVTAADTQYPIIVDGYTEGEGKSVGLVDGRHRKIKLMRQGAQNANVIKLTQEDISAAIQDYLAQQKTAAATLPEHVFVTGHSGAGKSTLAKRLAPLLNRRLVNLDDDPRWQTFLKGDPELGQPANSPVLVQGQALRRQIVADALQKATSPTMFEGAHLLSAPDLISGPLVVVDGTRERILAQRLKRTQAKALAKGKTLTPEELQTKQQLAQQVYDMYEPYVAKIKQHPKAITVSGRSRKPETVMHKLSEYAKGIPDKRYYRPINQLQEGQLIDYLVQQHNAYRAGPHKDVRFGDEKGLYSWATRKPLPTPGQRTALFEQPTHSHKYLGWEGEIPRGQYGGGTVKVEDQGKILVTSVKPDAIHFTLAHKRYPERFVMIKPKGWKQPKSWLLINKTPIAGLPYEKVRYKKIPAPDVEKYIDQMQRGDTFEAKIDGASSLIKVLKDGVEVVSYRQSKETGRPILYTEKLLDGLPKLDIPPELVGTVLKGELYGSRSGAGGKAVGGSDLEGLGSEGMVIPPQELGGILNSSLARALEDKRQRGIKLKNMVYDIQSIGKQPVDWHKTPRPDRRRLIEQVLEYLPKDTFHISPAAETPEDARKLWMDIQQGTHPLTHEGAVMWPKGGPPMKSKLTEDTDVYLTGTYPGEGKYTNTGIGGFTYGLEPGGPTVGRVGTGLSDSLRQEAFNTPDVWSGRVARIRAQEQLPSGAYRAPAFLAFHEDYPSAKLASVLNHAEVLTLSELEEHGIWTEDE